MIVGLLYKLLSRLPLPAAYRLADLVFPVFYYIIRYRRRLVRRNLSESLPGKGVRELRGIERRFYRFLLDLLLESCRMAAMKPVEMRRRMRFTGVEPIEAALREGRNVALYLGHIGNWEWGCSMPLWLRLPPEVAAAQVYHRLRDARMDALLKASRERFGARCVEMRSTARTLAHWTGEGRAFIVGFIADQSPRRRQISGYVPFLNHRTPVMDGPEKIAHHFAMEAWYIDVTRTGRGSYEACAVKMEGGEGLTAEYYRLLEGTIRRAPEFYLWSHNRFKYARRD